MKILVSLFLISLITLTSPKHPSSLSETSLQISAFLKKAISTSIPLPPLSSSEFIQWSFSQIGITLPKTIPFLMNTGSKISYDSLTIGDILFFNTVSLQPDFAAIMIDTTTMAYLSPEGNAIVTDDFTSPKWRASFVQGLRIYGSDKIETFFNLMYMPELTQSAFTTYVDPKGYHNNDPGFLRFYTEDISETDLLISEGIDEDNTSYKEYGSNYNNPNTPKHEVIQGYVNATHGVITGKRPLINHTSTQYVCIHDTGDDVRTAADWKEEITTSTRNISWHFSVDEKDIYQHLPLIEVGRHAGDAANEFGLLNTGIPFTNGTPKIEFKEDSHLYINDQKSELTLPEDATTRDITPAGLYTEEVDGMFYINKYYFNTDYEVVANGGGNRNSVGIETSIKNGNSYSRTMRKTANLVVHLLNVFNLSTKRVLQHRNFSGKTCPESMIRATEGCIFEYKQLLDLIEMEYFVMKQMNNSKISFVSNSKELLSDDGYLLKYVEQDTVVKYTVTVDYDGVIKTRQFETLIKTNKGPQPQPKDDNASWLKYTIGMLLMWAVLL